MAQIAKDHLSLESDKNAEIESLLSNWITGWLVSVCLACRVNLPGHIFLHAESQSGVWGRTRLFDVGQLQYVGEDVETWGLQQRADGLGQCRARQGQELLRLHLQPQDTHKRTRVTTRNSEVGEGLSCKFSIFVSLTTAVQTEYSYSKSAVSARKFFSCRHFVLWSLLLPPTISQSPVSQSCCWEHSGSHTSAATEPKRPRGNSQNRW